MHSCEWCAFSLDHRNPYPSNPDAIFSLRQIESWVREVLDWVAKERGGTYQSSSWLVLGITNRREKLAIRNVCLGRYKYYLTGKCISHLREWIMSDKFFQRYFWVRSRTNSYLNDLNLIVQKGSPKCVMKIVNHAPPYYTVSNRSSMRRSVSSPDETPRRELKIRRAAECFGRISRCFIWWWNTVECLILLLKRNDFRWRN